MLSLSEAVAACLITFPAAAILAAYLADSAGFSLHPMAVFATALLAALAMGRRLARRVTTRSRPMLVLFSVIVVGVAFWLLSLAWPELLPIGGGSDLTHHLMLVDFIERTGRSVHDHSLAAQLGEMVDYTPGAHLLAVVAGFWVRTDGLHTIYPIIALSVALKAGLVFLIAVRCVDDLAPRFPAALIAVVLLLLPHTFFIGSFTHDSFFAQVISELFAIAMWWAAIGWDVNPSNDMAALFGVFAAAAFVTWPVFVGPPLFVFAFPWLRKRSLESRMIRDAALAIVPLAIVAAIHLSSHFWALRIAGASGAAPIPSPDLTGWLFPLIGVVGLAVAARTASARSVAWMFLAIALQSAVLFIVARLRRAETPYLALKMSYLAIMPLAVAGAVGIADALDRIRTSRARRATLAWAAVVALAVWTGRSLARVPHPRPAISDELLAAGEWARAHVPVNCVDYLTADDDGGYWLHLAVLRNPRASERSRDPDTFEPDKALLRWRATNGLPFAIAENFDALPQAIRDHVDVLAHLGRAAVVQRRERALCSSENQPASKPSR